MPRAKTLTRRWRDWSARAGGPALEAAEYDPALMCSVRVAVRKPHRCRAAAEIDQQIRSFRCSTTFVDHRKLMALARGLGALRAAIAGPLADVDPATALSRILDFIALAPAVFERSDHDGIVGEEFQTASAAVATRRMIDCTLDHRRSKRYRHASRHLLSCAGLAPLITDWQGHQPHAEYAAGLRQRHPRKSSFWSRVDVLAKVDSRRKRPGRCHSAI